MWENLCRIHTRERNPYKSVRSPEKSLKNADFQKKNVATLEPYTRAKMSSGIVWSLFSLLTYSLWFQLHLLFIVCDIY